MLNSLRHVFRILARVRVTARVGLGLGDDQHDFVLISTKITMLVSTVMLDNVLISVVN